MRCDSAGLCILYDRNPRIVHHSVFAAVMADHKRSGKHTFVQGSVVNELLFQLGDVEFDRELNQGVAHRDDRLR